MVNVAVSNIQAGSHAVVDLALPGLYTLHAVSVCLVYTGYTQFCSVWYMQVTCNVALSGLQGQCSDECCCGLWDSQ